MSLLRELQQITERTYGQLLGINLEEFIIGRRRFRYLSKAASSPTHELSNAARVFFRILNDNLYLAIYFSNAIISALERHDPRRGLNEENITPFIIFFEEINHGVHIALKFSAGETKIQKEEFVRDLELIAKIDTYQILKFFLSYFNPSKQLEQLDRLWLRHHLFERQDVSYRNPQLGNRYCEVNILGEKYSRFLDGISSKERLEEIRRFREMSYIRKVRYVSMLP